jgi:hypothetical protein
MHAVRTKVYAHLARQPADRHDGTLPGPQHATATTRATMHACTTMRPGPYMGPPNATTLKQEDP